MFEFFKDTKINHKYYFSKVCFEFLYHTTLLSHAFWDPGSEGPIF